MFHRWNRHRYRHRSRLSPMWLIITGIVLVVGVLVVMNFVGRQDVRPMPQQITTEGKVVYGPPSPPKTVRRHTTTNSVTTTVAEPINLPEETIGPNHALSPPPAPSITLGDPVVTGQISIWTVQVQNEGPEISAKINLVRDKKVSAELKVVLPAGGLQVTLKTPADGQCRTLSLRVGGGIQDAEKLCPPKSADSGSGPQGGDSLTIPEPENPLVPTAQPPAPKNESAVDSSKGKTACMVQDRWDHMSTTSQPPDGSTGC